MKRLRFLIVLLVSLLLLAGCVEVIKIWGVKIWDKDNGWQIVVQKIIPQLSETEIMRSGLKIKTSEDATDIVLKDKNDTTVTTDPDATGTTDLNSFDPPGTGYKWVAYKTEPITAAADDTFTLSYKITNVWTAHAVTERMRRDSESWAEGASYEFQIGPETGADTYLYTIAGFMAVLTGTVFLSRSWSRRKRPHEIQ